MKKLRKQVINCILLLVVLLCISVSVTNAEELPTSGIGGKHITWTYDTETKTLTFTGYGKTQNNNGWYEMHGCIQDCGDWNVLKDDVESVVIGEGITQISDYAFYEFRKLKEVQFPSTLKKIGSSAFEGCRLEKLEFPPSLEKIEFDAFIGCKLDTLVKIGRAHV